MATASRSEKLGQATLAATIRSLVDDLQAAVTTTEWSRRARELRKVLEANAAAVSSAHVQHNIGERRHYLARFVQAQGVELA